MVTTLEDGERRLAELVERASQGEDVLITVGGKVRARLTHVEEGERAAPSDAAWMEQRMALLRKYANPNGPKLTVEQILQEDREDRL